MTDPHPDDPHLHDPHLDDRHPDDEALNAVFDGEATAEESAHAESCARCTARLTTLQEVAALVGAPVAPAPDARREEAVQTALAATEVVALRRRRSPPSWLPAAAAAAVVVVLAVAGLVVLGDDGDEPAPTAAGQPELEAGGGPEESTALQAPQGPVVAGDLGELDGVVAERVRGALGGGPQATERATEPDSGATAADEAAPSAAGGDAADGAGGIADDALVCESALRDEDRQAGALRLVGRGTFQGEEVVVLAFEVVSGDRRLLRVYLVDPGDCSIRQAAIFELD